MFDPETATMGHCIFVNSIPDGLKDWCKKRRIEGRVFECYDGGGFNRYVVEFEDAATKDLVAAEFLDDPEFQYLMGEGIHLLGMLWIEEIEPPAE